MSASQSLIHGVRSPLQANMVHLCSGHIVHNYLLSPSVILGPVSGSYSILLWRHTLNCTINVSSNITASKYAVHPLLPVIPIIICQVASLRDPINSCIFFGTYQHHSWIVGWGIIGQRVVDQGIISSQWITLCRLVDPTMGRHNKVERG